MTAKQKAGILSGLTTLVFNGILWILLLKHINATSVIWLWLWVSLFLGTISTCLIKYIFEVTNRRG